jgi:ABC-2 type transport system permease protein
VTVPALQPESTETAARGLADAPPAAPSPLRAWLALVALSLQRQARMRQMVWIALALLLLTAGIVAAIRWDNGWGMARWRWPRRVGPTYPELARTYDGLSAGLPLAPETAALHQMGAGAFEALLRGSPFILFARWAMFGMFLAFLLPLWSLSFATQALGGDREDRSLVWLLTRPLPRWSVYLAKFVGVLPWTLALNLGGFALICLAAGAPGRTAFRLFWPAVLGGSLAFAALFHFIGAAFRRPTVVALVYSFFLETLLGDMPGMMKRVSVSFYVRCVMFDAAVDYGLTPDKPSVYLPVSGAAAWAVLLGATAALLVLGMAVFGRTEYRDDG